MIGGSRAMYSMADSFMLPQVFSRLHSKYKTPVAALLLLGVLSILTPLLGRAMLIWIVDAANFACCFAYCMVAVAYILIRRRRPDLNRPFKLKHGISIGTIAVIMSGFMVLMYLLPGTNCTLTWEEWLIVGGWAVLGLAFAVRSKMRYKEKFASGLDI